MALTLIGGGSRSGKSAKALELALECDGPRLFVATAEARDAEMRARIARHRADRGPAFETIEEPIDVAPIFARPAVAIVVDCLTLWLSNVLLAGCDVDREATRLLDAAVASQADIFVVTNEVGCGIVPDNALARDFRDAQGRLNQQAAARAGAVYLMAFGLAVKLK